MKKLMAENNAFFENFFLFFSKKIAMYACMHEMQTNLNKERNKHIFYLHITHNKPKLSNDISTLISFARVFNGEFFFLGLLSGFLLINRG